MKLSVGTDPVELGMNGDTTPLIQNLGPGDIYWDADPAVSVETGLLLPAGSMYEFPRDLGQGIGRIYLVATEAATDLRAVAVG